MIDRAYTVYVVERGKRPRRANVTVPCDGNKPIPSTIDVDGKTFHWTTADISSRTLTYVDWKPAPTAAVAS